MKNQETGHENLHVFCLGSNENLLEGSGNVLIVIWILQSALPILSGKIFYSFTEIYYQVNILIFNNEDETLVLLLWLYNIKNQFQFIHSSFSFNFKDS